MVKTCTRCKKEKALDQFAKRSSSQDKKDYYCKSCRAVYSFKSQKNNKRRCTWNECHRPHWAHGLCRLHLERKTNGRAMDRAEDSVTKYRHLKTYYKLDKETYDEMAKNGCKICSSKEFLHVDHDHSCCEGKKSCGKCIRGIVCHSCNAHLGKLDSGTIALENKLKPKLLQYILDYELKKKSLA